MSLQWGHRGHMRRILVIPALLLAVLTPFGVPAAAVAGGGGDAQGGCSRSADWRLKTDLHNGRIEVEGRVDSDRNGQRWYWRILHNGDVSFRGSKVTDNGGEIRVERSVVNVSGTDRIGWRATNRRSGETCSGNVSV